MLAADHHHSHASFTDHAGIPGVSGRIRALRKGTPGWGLQRRHQGCGTLPAAAKETSVVDVVVVGAGIIGLCTAHKLLQQTDLTVALVDRQEPCAGATGAGQGYIWLAHRDPLSPAWALAQHSKAAWERQVAADPLLRGALEWQETGSLLLATTASEVQDLQERRALLRRHGVQQLSLLDHKQLHQKEPALQLPAGSAGLLTSGDAQLNGRATALHLLEQCRGLSGVMGRCHVLLHEDVQALECGGGGSSSGGSSNVTIDSCSNAADKWTTRADVVVETSSRRLRARHGVVVAAGVWSGSILAAATGNAAWAQLLQPRRGHLLEITPPHAMRSVRHGMMELSYSKHYQQHAINSPTPAASGEPAESDSSNSSTKSVVAQQLQHRHREQQQSAEITFTATTSASGTLLIGSSREFSGWGTDQQVDTVRAILQRASCFLPHLRDLNASMPSVRVGLRPYAVGGLPAVGRVQGLPGVVVAAGHEGSGLCLAPATAELALHHLLGLPLDLPIGENMVAGALAAARDALLPVKRLATLVKTQSG